MSHPKTPESVADSRTPPSDDPEDNFREADERAHESANLSDGVNLANPYEPVPPPPRQRRNWPLVLVAVVLAAGVGVSWQQWQANGRRQPAAAAAGQPKGVPVKLAAVESTPVQDASEFVGSLEAKRTVEVKPEAEGQVTQIFVQPGDVVEKGQAIARIKSDTAEADVRQAQANLIRTQARLAELQAGSRPEEIAAARARLAQAVAGLAELQAGSRPETIAEAQARVAQAEANLADAETGSLLEDITQAEAQVRANTAEVELASQQARRYEQLRNEGAESENTYQQYLQKDRSARANLQEAQQRLQQRKKNRIAEIERRRAALEQQRQALLQLRNGARVEDIARAQAEVAEARSQLAQLQNGTRPEQIAQAEAAVAEAAAQVRSSQVTLQETAVVAPFAGVIADVPIKVGDYLKIGDPITTLTENQVLDLRLSVPLERQPQLRIGLPVQMLDAQGNAIAQGQISFISPDVDTSSQTVLAKASFPNPNGELLNRQFVKARAIWKQRPGLVVPVTAVTRLGGETFVFVAQKPEQSKPGMPPLVAKQKRVKLGDIQGNNYQVLEGLQAGERLIVSGILNLTDGVPILPESATGNGGGAEAGKQPGESKP